ncbi:MAG TPA: FAD binding domain-containing protein [Thermoplasmata archaeon]|nr:FAD binding domain-containing protein [Thermoplasmata archaeon]
MPFTLEVPADVPAALRAIATGPPGRTVVLAGGTDLMIDLDLGRIAPERVVSLRRLPWRSLARRGDRLVIGSLLPLRDLERDPLLPGDQPGLYEAIRAVGSVALRTRATLGGNVVRSAPASDLVPVLLAADAEVHLIGPDGPRRRTLVEFLAEPRRPGLAPGELVEAIALPKVVPSAYVWQRVRPANDISQVGVAVGRPDPSGPWRVALGGIAPVPARVPEAEAFLSDPRPAPARIAEAADAAARAAPFVSDRRATEAYRRLVVRVLTTRALTTALARSAPREAGP